MTLSWLLVVAIVSGTSVQSASMVSCYLNLTLLLSYKAAVPGHIGATLLLCDLILTSYICEGSFVK